MEQPKARYLLLGIPQIKRSLGNDQAAVTYIHEHIIASLDALCKECDTAEIMEMVGSGQWGYGDDINTLAVNDVADKAQDDMQLFHVAGIDKLERINLYWLERLKG